MKQRYEVAGMMEWHPVFHAGRTRVRVSFTGGHLCGGGMTPAVFETSDPVVQAVIERSEAFRSGRIRRAWSRSDDAKDSGGNAWHRPVAEAPRCAEAVVRKAVKDPGVSETVEFDSLDKAQDFLQFKKHVPTSRILDIDSCIREAAMLGITLKIKVRK